MEAINRDVLLFPSIHDLFLSYLKTDLKESKKENDGKSVADLEVSKWILSNLTATFRHHVKYACKAHKYVTLVYRPGTDLVLYQSLYGNSEKMVTPTPKNVPTYNSKPTQLRDKMD